MPLNFHCIGVLQGHRGWITAVAAPASDSSILVTASRDKTLIKWDVSLNKRTSTSVGVPVKSLVGHSDFVQAVQVSSDGAFALSGSWDNTLALWDLNTGNRRAVFRGHTNDVTSVAFSPCNRQIVSGSRDRTIKVWNTIAEFKCNLQGEPHSDWVSCVRFSPTQDQPIVVSGGHDGRLKVWSVGQTWALKHSIDAHDGYVSSICLSPDGSLCASGGKDGVASLWDIVEKNKLYSLGDKGSSEPITSLIFSPYRYWLSLARGNTITVYDLESREEAASLVAADPSGQAATVTCLAWSPDGNVLYAGYTDHQVRVWQVSQDSA